ncbi:MAG: hypothetical protein AAF630_01070 [Cyanobacteria bacterium P01_C01_bin.38]
MNCFSKSILSSILLITATISVASASTKESYFDIAQADSQPERTFEYDNFKIELKGCSRNEKKTVVCNFIMTNLVGRDRSFRTSRYISRATDSSGNRYPAFGVNVANQGRSGTLITDIPTPVTISFAAPSKVDSLAVLDIRNYSSKGTFRFRDVKINGYTPNNSSNTTSTAANTNNPERWLTMGKTNDGNIVSLDVNSIQNQSESLKFRYRITDNTETRERIAVTNVCRNGKISSQPEWKVEFQDKVLVIEANSPGSLNLLKKVCSSV